MFDLDGEYISKSIFVEVEPLMAFPCVVAWCNNTQLSWIGDGGGCLCNECNKVKHIPIRDEQDFLVHQNNMYMSLDDYRCFVSEHGGICREASLDEHGARIYQRELNLFVGIG